MPETTRIYCQSDGVSVPAKAKGTHHKGFPTVDSKNKEFKTEGYHEAREVVINKHKFWQVIA